MRRVTQNHRHRYTGMYTGHVNNFVVLSLGLIALKGIHKTYFWIPKMPIESSLSQLSRLKSVIFKFSSSLLSESKVTKSYYSPFLLSSLFCSPLFYPHCLFPPELPTTMAGLPLLVFPFSTLLETQNKPPWEGHRPEASVERGFTHTNRGWWPSIAHVSAGNLGKSAQKHIDPHICQWNTCNETLMNTYVHKHP